MSRHILNGILGQKKDVRIKLHARQVASVMSGSVAHQAPLFTGFSRQESWGELPFPSPGDLPHPGIKLVSLMSLHWQVFFFFFFLTTSATWEAQDKTNNIQIKYGL